MRGRLKTSSEQIGYFTDFFSRVGADTCDLARLFIYNEGSMRSVSQDCIEIHVKEDTWRIRKNDEGITLLHNNYQVKDDYSRSFEKGFHVQGNAYHPSFHCITEAMCTYSFDYHRRMIEAYDKKVRWLHFETGLAIANNYVCCDRRSILFNYFTFIDIQGKEPSSRKFQGMKILNRTEKDGYTVITCRIPFWKRTEFEGMMGSLKKRALKERRFEYLDVCESAVPQPA